MVLCCCTSVRLLINITYPRGIIEFIYLPTLSCHLHFAWVSASLSGAVGTISFDLLTAFSIRTVWGGVLCPRVQEEEDKNREGLVFDSTQVVDSNRLVLQWLNIIHFNCYRVASTDIISVSIRSSCQTHCQCSACSVAMPVLVVPALIPDLEKVYDVYFDAFKHEHMASIMLNILFPNGITPEFRKHHTAATLDWWHKAKDQYTYKVIDTDRDGEIIGMILADAFFKERTEEERKWAGIPWLEGKERERADAVTKPLWEKREKLFGGRKYICK